MLAEVLHFSIEYPGVIPRHSSILPLGCQPR
jgi:hypothetical protein